MYSSVPAVRSVPASTWRRWPRWRRRRGRCWWNGFPPSASPTAWRSSGRGCPTAGSTAWFSAPAPLGAGATCSPNRPWACRWNVRRCGSRWPGATPRARRIPRPWPRIWSAWPWPGPPRFARRRHWKSPWRTRCWWSAAAWRAWRRRWRRPPWARMWSWWRLPMAWEDSWRTCRTFHRNGRPGTSWFPTRSRRRSSGSRRIPGSGWSHGPPSPGSPGSPDSSTWGWRWTAARRPSAWAPSCRPRGRDPTTRAASRRWERGAPPTWSPPPTSMPCSPRGGSSVHPTGRRPGGWSSSSVPAPGIRTTFPTAPPNVAPPP